MHKDRAFQKIQENAMARPIVRESQYLDISSLEISKLTVEGLSEPISDDRICAFQLHLLHSKQRADRHKAERSLRVVTTAVLVQSLGDTPHIHETWTLNYVAMSTNYSVDNTAMSTFLWFCSVL